MNRRKDLKVLDITERHRSSRRDDGFGQGFDIKFNIALEGLVSELVSGGWVRLDGALEVIEKVFEKVHPHSTAAAKMKVAGLFTLFGRLMSGPDQNLGLTYVIDKGEPNQTAYVCKFPIPRVSAKYILVPRNWIATIVRMLRQGVVAIVADLHDRLSPYAEYAEHLKKLKFDEAGFNWKVVGNSIKSTKEQLSHFIVYE